VIRIASALAALWAISCAPLLDVETPSATEARALAGVPVDGFPNYVERQMHLAINRARSAPNDVAAGNANDCSAQKNATPPLMFDLAGARAARFHAKHSTLNMGGLTHDSYCTLRQDIAATNCDGAAACACETGSECFSCTTLGGCGTPFYSRASLFGFAANGEVGAAGYADGFAAVRGWVTECPPADGHRQILTGADKDVIGLGHADNGGCWGSFDFGDTGYQALAPVMLPSGVHVPETGGAGTMFDFYVSYFSAGAARTVQLVVDGVCFDMALELGTPQNATYKTSRAVGAGCHEYYFYAENEAGAPFTYPESGAWGTGECSAYTPSRMPAACNNIDPCQDTDMDGVDTCEGDCNDADAAVFPGAPELCNELDDNCNATDDEGCACGDGETRGCGFDEGACTLGMQTCTGGQWGACIGAFVPDGGCNAPVRPDAGSVVIAGEDGGPSNEFGATKSDLSAGCGCSATKTKLDPAMQAKRAVSGANEEAAGGLDPPITGMQAKRAVSGANEEAAGGLDPPITGMIALIVILALCMRRHARR
jgi:hypothetical protein